MYREPGGILIKSQSQPIQDKPPLGLISSVGTPSADKRLLIKIGCKGGNMKGKAESIIEDIVETDGETSSSTIFFAYSFGYKIQKQKNMVKLPMKMI